jgi:adenylate kinase family enzyme
MKYVKWVYGNKSNHNDFEYKIDEINVADNWNPDGGFDDMGGFNFTNEENALRWVTRGDVLYDVIIPEGVEVIDVKNSKTPGGIIRTNKIIITNPRPITEELMHELYKKSNMPERTYYECIAALAMHNCIETCLEVIRDKVNISNIEQVIDYYNHFLKPWHEGYVNQEGWNYILEILNEIKSKTDISLCVFKEPYVKKISEDRIINLTGQSGAGKSYYAKENFNTEEYVIIDTDDILSEKRFLNATGLNKDIGEYLRVKYTQLPDLGKDFDLIYNEIIDYCKNIDKTIVIDCAQFHCIKDMTLLKGTIIIIRTDIDTCYNRAISRWINNHKERNINYTNDELNAYKARKKLIYKWYKGTNSFIRKIEEI